MGRGTSHDLEVARGLESLAAADAGAALEAFDAARAMAPDDARVALLAAEAARATGICASARFADALSLAPGDGAAAIGLAEALLAEENPVAADALIAAWLDRTPSWIEGQAWLAKQRFMAGEADYARALDHALMADRENVALWQARIALDFHGDRYAAALDRIEAAERATGRHPRWTAQRAAALDECGNPEAAAALYATLDPAVDVGLAVRIARHHLRRGSTGEALVACEPWLGTTRSEVVWPYIALAWRVAGDPRWEWLEGQPGLIGVYDVPLDAITMETLAVTTRALHHTIRQPIDQSLRGGTQTAGQLLARAEPAYRGLRAALTEVVAAHCAGLPPRDPFHPTLRHRRDAGVRFAGSWSVRLVDGGHHVAHVHSQGWLSSAFYLALPDPQAGASADSGWLALGEPGTELELDLTPLRLIEPRLGRLVLFPSTMWHATRPFGRGERLTIAFDVAPPDG